MSMDKVPLPEGVGPGSLYIGGIFTIHRPVYLKANNITHILSAIIFSDGASDIALVEKMRPYKHHVVPLNDVADENLLEYIAEAAKFIKEGIEGGGGVLVHCAMGKSRSASVIIAYLMSLSPTTTPTIALASLRKARPMAEPNSGFMQQLELYHQMGCPNDVNIHPMYQRWLYQQEVKLSIACGRAPESIRFEDETADGTGRGEVEIRCRKCRRSLATSAYLIPHSPKTSSVSHNNENDQEADMKPISSLGPTNSIPQQQCAHLFLDPLSWMRPELEQGKLDGRLECPNTKCKTNVGKYAWQGMKCSCRAWVVPAITLARGRVDEIESRPTPFMAAANGGGKI